MFMQLCILIEEIQHLLNHHFDLYMKDNEYQRINVRRQLLLQDAMKQFQCKSCDVSKLIQVELIGEPAVDTGVHRREFFQLLMIDLMSKSGLFEGYPSFVTPAHNVVSLSTDQCMVARNMIATSIIQGGPAPHCFATAVAEILVYKEVKSEFDLSKIHDLNIWENLEKVRSVGFNSFMLCHVGSNHF